MNPPNAPAASEASNSQRYLFEVLVFFVCLFCLTASGRLASVDAGSQLQASVLLATTGSLGSSNGPAGMPLWWPGKDGRFYQAHDLGNVLLMLPSAWICSAVDKRPVLERIWSPSLVAKVGVSLTYACLAALGCWGLFILFSQDYPRRVAFVLSLGLPCCTFYWAYARAAWDVMGASCAFVAIMLTARRLMDGNNPWRWLIGLSVATAVTCTFRYSLGPFIVPPVLAAVWIARRHLRPVQAVAGIACFGALMVPTLIYNHVRTGEFWRPATASAVYLAGDNALTGNMVSGAASLLFAPNGGVFIFAPIVLLICLLPWVWRCLRPGQVRLLTFFGLGAIAYLGLISRMKNWGAFGWGPRYLVPILPLIYYAAALVAARLWNRIRWSIVALVVVSLVAALPPALINWSLTIARIEGGMDRHSVTPRQIVGAWQVLAGGLAGEPLPLGREALEDPDREGRGNFPDIWLFRLIELGGAMRAFGRFVVASLLVALLTLSFRLLRQQAVVACPAIEN